MNEKEKLYNLIRDYINKRVDSWNFCNDFTKVFGLEVDSKDLTKEEYTLFSELDVMTARFSDIEEDLKIKNLYFNEAQIREKVDDVARKLKIA